MMEKNGSPGHAKFDRPPSGGAGVRTAYVFDILGQLHLPSIGAVCRLRIRGNERSRKKKKRRSDFAEHGAFPDALLPMAGCPSGARSELRTRETLLLLRLLQPTASRKPLIQSVLEVLGGSARRTHR